MIKNILNIFGLIQVKNITDEELSSIIINKWTGDFSDDIDKDAEKKLFKSLVGIEGFGDYLRISLIGDIKRYYKALPLQQSEVRGAFMRTSYIRSKLIEASKESTTKLNGLRYGH